MTPDELWYGMLNEVKKKIPSTMYSTWIESSLILVSYENDIVTIDTAKSFVRAFIKKKYNALLEEAASKVTGRPTKVNIIYSSVDTEEEPPTIETPSPDSIESSTTPSQDSPAIEVTPEIEPPKEKRKVSIVTGIETIRKEDLQPRKKNQSLSDKELSHEADTLYKEVKLQPETLLTADGELDFPEIRDAQKLSVPPNQSVVESDGLGSNYTFDTFIVGNSNRMAHAAALAIAETPAERYNPYFIYGGSGLGKTHLMHAIGHRIREKYPDMVIRCITSEDFANELIQSLQDKNPESFRQRYRNVDVLLVDDIQFLENKEHTQEEFFHTFNKLYQDHKQMVFTSDRPPQDIKKLEERLRSRFQGGMVTCIEPPDLETRTAILRNRAQQSPISFEKDALDFIAANVSENIRQLEGAFAQVSLLASQEHSPVTLELTQKALKDLIQANSTKKYITLDEITKAVCQFYKVKYEDMMSKKKAKSIAFPRQVAMYLCRVMTEQTYPHIGASFNGRDHTTVMHACTKIENIMKEDEHIRRSIEELKAQITNVDN
ncbi:MAG: chromosomal replication initiator protein DnaA [Megasphaera sp.]|nr:chromosomal replication initiator protein DnaA [Megasphaera sp.]